MRAITEGLAIVATIDPDAYGTGAQNSDVIDMLYWKEIVVTVMAGALGSSATLDCVVNGDTASGGAYATLITGKSITQLTEAGTDSDKQAVIRVTDEEVAAQGLRYVRVTATLGAATSDYGVLVQAVPKSYGPAFEYDLASVDEIIP